MKIPHARPLIQSRLLWVLVVLWMGAGAWLLAGSGGLTIFFFSPETNVNNYNTVKSEFDAYFAERSGPKFQPLGNRRSFEQFLTDDTSRIFLMSSWHYRQLKDKEAWKPVLVGMQKNRTTRKHHLFARKGSGGLAGMRGKTIASAGTREYTLNLLRQMLGDTHKDLIGSFKILVVPKDIDALMSVSFGASQAAVATEYSADKLSRINPKQFQALAAMTRGKDSLLPVVVISASADPNVDHCVKLLSGMGGDPDGKQRLNMLGLDGWQAITESQVKRLEE